MKKILYISYDGMTDPLGQSQVLPYLIGLRKIGYQITLLSTEKPEAFEKGKGIIEQICAENKLNWKPIFYTKKPPVLSTLRDVRTLRKAARKLHQTENFDIVHCRSYISALVGIYLKKRFKLKFIFDMRGFWADERVDGGLWNLKNPLYRTIYRYFKRKERNFLQKADYTITLTESAKQEILSWSLLHQSPIQVIPCCADTDLFQIPTEKPANQPFTLCYLGSLGTWYLLKEMLGFYRKLLEKKPTARFLFITPDKPDLITSQARQLELPLAQIQIQKATRKQVPELLAKADISVFFIKPAYSKKGSSATKMGEILAMGIPIIANTAVGDNDYLFEKYPCGYLLRQLKDDSYAEAVAEIDALLKISPEVYRTTALSYFGLEKGIMLYKQVYEAIEHE
jgi:glycosyltransferase involved in cell wall biosynthesis